jgi:hypothetical protein
MTINQLTAIFYILITVVVIFFQLLIVLGAPWGEFTQGGRFKGTLPLSGRITAALSIPVLIFMGTSIASVSGLIFELYRWTAYATLALQGITAIFNLLTPSLKERRLWGPVTTIAFILATYSTYSS